MRLFIRAALVISMVAFGFAPAEAARINLSETSGGGGGTIINDGTGDVVSSDGSARSLTSFSSVLSELVGDVSELDQLRLTGTVSGQSDFDVATSADISVFRIYATIIDGALPAGCSDCATPSQVKIGIGGLHLNPDPSTQDPTDVIDESNVLFAINAIGPSLSASTWGGPAGMAGVNVALNTAIDYQLLNAAQIQFIVGRLNAYNLGLSDVRIGIGAQVNGVGGPVEALLGVEPVPEPGTLLLLASGAAMLAVRRRRAARH